MLIRFGIERDDFDGYTHRGTFGKPELTGNENDMKMTWFRDKSKIVGYQ